MLILLLMVGYVGCAESGDPNRLDAMVVIKDGEVGGYLDADHETTILDILDPFGDDAFDGVCESCDSVEASNPFVDEFGGIGDITTYGSVFDPLPSSGGACNYGKTNIQYFAAINVNIKLNDGLGQWQEGRICGQCASISAKTVNGWKEVIVRIVDKCPDQYCGIDLGGAPARDIMEDKPGRYAGKWHFVSCNGHRGVSDGSPCIFVKDGSNPWWALIQVRNPPMAVTAIDWEILGREQRGTFAYAKEAENFYSVSEEVRSTSDTVQLTVHYSDKTTHRLDIAGNALTQAKASYPL